LLQYIDELTERTHSLERSKRPTLEEFQARVAGILPALREDVDFLRLVIDTLRVERVAYRELHDYITAQGWHALLAQRP
jgi:hypothetical protein